MTREELEQALKELNEVMDTSVAMVSDAAAEAQKQVLEMVLQLLTRIDTAGGRLLAQGNYRALLNQAEQKISTILGEEFRPAVSAYLDSYRTVEETTITLHKDYNDLEVSLQQVSPARRFIYDQTRYYLSQGLRDAYVLPAKQLLMRQVVTGVSLKEAEDSLRSWDAGQTTITSGQRQAPNLQRYATQLARDSIYQFNGQVNNIIKNDFELDAIIYVGDIIEDSRPLCRHLVQLRKAVPVDEIEPLLKKYPQGTYPGTNAENFPVYRGGYSCRHQAFPTKIKKRS